ncbi:MAG: 16S rRNA processing protein RimM [Nitrospinae bacterium]|nr:16S rRNA processing protein RimM [Nitrospinota bacterium]
MRDGLVPIGSVLRPHGLAGELVVYPYLNDLAYYGRVREVGTLQEDESVRWHRVQHACIAGDRILLQLEGYRSRDALPALIGLDLHVPRAELPPLDAREFYWYDLEGLSVYTQEGDFLGRVVDFFPTGSNEVLVVQDGPREALIPFIGEVILAVDETQRCLRIRALPGLL